MKAPVMTAVRWEAGSVRLVEVRRPRPATGQVLVRVGAVAIGRRDGEPQTGPHPMQLDPRGGRTLGTHVVGTVAAPGAGVDGWALGRSVALQPEVALRRGWFMPGASHDGGLAEYVVAPVEGLVLLPPDLPASVAVQLPLAARAYSMLMHGRLRPGESLGIWGAGALGGACLGVARALGAAPLVVVDPSAEARAAAGCIGADAELHPTEPRFSDRIAELTARRGLDLVVHAAPDAGAAAQSVSALGDEGRAILAGPVRGVGESARWDGRTLSGPPRVDPGALPRLAHLASQGRLRLSPLPSLSGGLRAAAALLDLAVQGGHQVGAHLVTFSSTADLEGSTDRNPD